jgi:amphi-Trp domain-containing protein
LVTPISTGSCTVAETFRSRNRSATQETKGGPVVTIPWRFRSRARRDVAAFYLAELTQGLLAGKLDVLIGHETVPLEPAEFVGLEITVTRKFRVDHVSVRIRWPRGRNRTFSDRRPARISPARPRGTSHLDFTSPSFGRNAEARDSQPDANNR